MLANAKIHAVVPVTVLARARAFYEGLLELPVLREETDQAVVVYQAAGTYLLLYERATASSGEHTVAGFELESGFDAVVDELLARGVTFDTFELPGVDMAWDDRGVLREGDRAAVWFKDPDGNVLTIGQGSM